MGLVLFGWAFGLWNRALSPRGVGTLAFVLLAWTLLHVGTLWLNAALDRDEGEVLFGRAVQVPEGIERFAWTALVGAAVVSWLGGVETGLVGTASVVLAGLYSHPRTRWKAHPLGGPFVNGVGYGLLTPLAGWLVVDTPPDARTTVVWLLVGLAALGGYYMAQVFQEQEDRERQYRTLVATHGAAVTLQVARACTVGALAGALLLAAVGWLPRVVLLTLPLAVRVDRWFARWSRQPDGGGEAWAREAARRVVLTGMTGVALMGAQTAVDLFVGNPPAGLGTAAGHPVRLDHAIGDAAD